MHNVELKAELRDLALARGICKALGATYIHQFGQVDTYYRIPQGRLKRRETEGEPIEYIFYERPNRAAPKLSNFTIFSAEQALERYGQQPLPIFVVVRKHRELWMAGNVRIHLDSVARLGTFIEFESLVSRDHSVACGHEALAQLRKDFGPVMGELIDCSYADLLEREFGEHVQTGPAALPPGHRPGPAPGLHPGSEG